MREINRRFGWKLLLASICLFVSSDNSSAQTAAPSSEEELKITARYHIESGTEKGFLIVKLRVPQDSYIYSLTQSSPLLPSKLKVVGTEQFTVGKNFTPGKKPKVIERDPVFETRVEKHFGSVQFYVPIKVAQGANLEMLKPEVQYFGQVCSKQGFCKQINGLKAGAKFAGYYQNDQAAGVRGGQSTNRQAKKLELPFIKGK